LTISGLGPGIIPNREEEEDAEGQRQFLDNPATETPEDDAYTFNVRYKVGCAADACVYFHRKLSERLR